jgi:hypothetical protein
MMVLALRWLWMGLVLTSAVLHPAHAADQCPEMWSVQGPLVQVSKIARVFRDGIDRTYIKYTRADFESKIDDLAASRVFEVQSFLTNRLEAIHTNAWQTFELLGEASAITPRRSAVQVAGYLTGRIALALDVIEQYEYHSGNLYDNVSNLARREVLAGPNTEIGKQYGSRFASLLEGLRKELSNATHALRQIKRCLE